MALEGYRCIGLAFRKHRREALSLFDMQKEFRDPSLHTKHQ